MDTKPISMTLTKLAAQTKTKNIGTWRFIARI